MLLFHTVYFLLQVTPFRPQVHRGLATQWAHKTEQIKHFQDSVKTHSYMDMSKQEGNYPSKINREKLTMFCEICSLSPRQVPQIPHAKKLHSHHLQINQKKRSLPLVLGDFEPIYQSECKFHPTPSFAQRSIFKQTMLPADQHANGGNSSVRTTKAAKRRWPYLFCQPPLASWNPSFLATSGTFCFWSGESVLKRGICHNSRPSWLFGLLASRACVCVCVCVCVSPLRLLHKQSWVWGWSAQVSSPFSDERSIHLSWGMAPQPSHGPSGGWCLVKCTPCFSCFQYYQKYPSWHFALRHGKQSSCSKESQASLRQGRDKQRLPLGFFFFFNWLLPCIWGSGWLFSVDDTLSSEVLFSENRF